jgi:hypothetical protein
MFSNLSRVTEGIFEYVKKVAKSAENGKKIPIFAHMARFAC